MKKTLLSRKYIETMLKEVQIMKELDHPNILKVYEIYHDSVKFYVISELVKGCELFDLIKERKTFSEPEASKVLH